MKRLIIGTSITTVLLLAGCAEEGTKEQTSEINSDQKKETKAAPKKETAKKEDSQVEKSEAGTKTIYLTKKNLGIAKKLGPINFAIDKIQTSRLEVAKGYEDMFNKKKEVTLVILNVKVENTSDKTISVYPDQATITTNTGEQLQAETFISDQVGGEFIGKVKKEGNVMFVANSKPEEITNVKFIMDGPHDENLTSLAERYTVEIPTKK